MDQDQDQAVLGIVTQNVHPSSPNCHLGEQDDRRQVFQGCYIAHCTVAVDTLLQRVGVAVLCHHHCQHYSIAHGMDQ